MACQHLLQWRHMWREAELQFTATGVMSALEIYVPNGNVRRMLHEQQRATDDRGFRPPAPN